MQRVNQGSNIARGAISRLIFAAPALVGIVFLLCAFSGGNPGQRPDFEQSSFAIVRPDGARYVFKAEVAKTEEQHAYGLMNVHSLPADRGMIFTFYPPVEAAFWMKNTYIPLDILFVRPDGIIGRIAASAQPQDMTPIHSQEPISAVLEINGGLAKKYGLRAGDRVEFPSSE
ncbi:MAG: DUF192 domain-containing protein [Bdellovibrionales bacterium]